jgi:hypothetical protein
MRLTADKLVEHLRACPQAVAAWAVGLSPRTFRDKHVPRNADGSYNLRSVVGDFLQQRENVDLATGPGDSPSLERLRSARAREAEAALLERLGELSSRAQMAVVMSEVCAGARRFAERMIRLYGTAASDEWNDIAAQIQAAVNSKLRLGARRREMTVYEGSEPAVTIDLNLLATGEHHAVWKSSDES